MKVTENELRQLYQSMTARHLRRSEDCLGEEVLIRAASNDLRAKERDKIVAHIAACSDCAREYRIARSLRPAAIEVQPEVDVTRWWGVAAAVALLLIVPLIGWLAFMQRRDAQVIAGLQQRIESQQRELESARRNQPRSAAVVNRGRPQVGVPIVDLDADTVRGAGAIESPIVVPPTSEVFALILHLPQPVDEPFDLQLVNANRVVLWHDRVQPERHASSITLALNRSLVSAGAYAIVVRSAESQTTFHFRVEYR